MTTLQQMITVKGVQLSKQLIVATSLEILSEYGLGDVSMRRLASRLDVAPGALYWHVKNKQALIEAMATAITDDFITQSAQLPIHPTAETFRRVVLSYRDGAEVVTAGLASPHLRSRVEEHLAASMLLRHSAATDVTATDTATVAFTLLHFMTGAVSTEQTRVQLAALGTDEQPSIDTRDAAAQFSRGVGLILGTTSA